MRDVGHTQAVAAEHIGDELVETVDEQVSALRREGRSRRLDRVAADADALRALLWAPRAHALEALRHAEQSRVDAVATVVLDA